MEVAHVQTDLSDHVQVGVLGGGFMGGGIAEVVARAGHQVLVYEPVAEFREVPGGG